MPKNKWAIRIDSRNIGVIDTEKN